MRRDEVGGDFGFGRVTLLPLPAAMALASARQAQDEGQCDVHPVEIAGIEVPNDPTSSFAQDRDRFIGHHLRYRSQAISISRFYCNAEV
jgi:hypothetical protein